MSSALCGLDASSLLSASLKGDGHLHVSERPGDRTAWPVCVETLGTIRVPKATGHDISSLLLKTTEVSQTLPPEVRTTAKCGISRTVCRV